MATWCGGSLGYAHGGPGRYALDEDSDDDDNEEAVRLCLRAAGLAGDPIRTRQCAGAAAGCRLAAAFGKAAALSALVDAGSDVNARDAAVSGNGPLHWAVLHGHAEAAMVLINAGADVTMRNRNGHSAIDLARERGGLDALIQSMERTPTGRREKAARAASDAAVARHEEEREAWHARRSQSWREVHRQQQQ